MFEKINRNRVPKIKAEGQLPLIIDDDDLTHVSLLFNETPIDMETALNGFFHKLKSKSIVDEMTRVKLETTVSSIEKVCKWSAGITEIDYELTDSDNNDEEKESSNVDEELNMSSESEDHQPPAKRRRFDVDSTSMSGAELESWANKIERKIQKLFFGFDQPNYVLAAAGLQKQSLLQLIESARFKASDVMSYIIPSAP